MDENATVFGIRYYLYNIVELFEYYIIGYDIYNTGNNMIFYDIVLGDYLICYMYNGSIHAVQGMYTVLRRHTCTCI